MQFVVSLLLLALPLHATSTSPLSKVLNMLSDLEAKIIKEGEVAHTEFAEFTEWCDDRSLNLGFEIKTGTNDVAGLKAVISQQTAAAFSLTERIGQLGAGIATDEADLKAATHIRETEAADFSGEEKELMDTVDILRRAIQILEREMKKGGASMLQVRDAGSLAQAFSVLVQASMLDTSDASKLTAFVQASQKSKEDDEYSGSPAAAVYTSQSGNIVDVLENLLDKAETQLDESRKKEISSKHNYEMLKQSLQDEVDVAKKEMVAAKTQMAASAEKKVTAEGDLKVVAQELTNDKDVKNALHQDCMSRSQDFQAETKSRGEELKTLAEAKAILKEATGEALTQTSLLQFNSVSRGDSASLQVVHLVRDLAEKQNSRVLAQLAVKMSSALHSGVSNPFGKVKDLISDMIDKLESEAGADATEKAYCDKELKESKAKKADKTAEIDVLGTRVDQMSSKSAILKEQVAILQNEMAKLMSSQATMDKMRQEEKHSFDASKAEQDKGLAGVKLAMKVLRDYYAKTDADHKVASGSAKGIMSLLEVIESDITKTLAGLMTDEDAAVSEYETMSQKNEIEKATKEQSIKYKGKESKELDKSIAENVADRSGVQAELDAVLEYLSKIEERCIAKAEAYSDRVSRREAELAGLKEALRILESDTAFLQLKHVPRTLRGSK